MYKRGVDWVCMREVLIESGEIRYESGRCHGILLEL